MTEPLQLNSIERLGRALFATLAPITGVRGTGTVSVMATTDDDVTVPANTYLLPVVGGQLRDDLVFKTTADVVVVGGSLTPAAIPITSNAGGARHNLPDATVLRFDPPVPGIDPVAVLGGAITDASDEGQLVRSLAWFEDLDSANPQKDIFAAKLGEYPGLMLVWAQSEPAEGATAGLRQGANRGRRMVRFWRESFVLYVVVGRLTGDTGRRQEGLVVMQAATRLLTDRMQNDDGEQLSTIGAGVEITGRARLRRGERHYIYALRVRVNQTLQPFDARTFNAWIATQYEGELPGRESPEPTDGIQLVDDLEPMP